MSPLPFLPRETVTVPLSPFSDPAKKARVEPLTMAPATSQVGVAQPLTPEQQWAAYQQQWGAYNYTQPQQVWLSAFSALPQTSPLFHLLPLLTFSPPPHTFSPSLTFSLSLRATTIRDTTQHTPLANSNLLHEHNSTPNPHNTNMHPIPPPHTTVYCILFLQTLTYFFLL